MMQSVGLKGTSKFAIRYATEGHVWISTEGNQYNDIQGRSTLTMEAVSSSEMSARFCHIDSITPKLSKRHTIMTENFLGIHSSNIPVRHRDKEKIRHICVPDQFPYLLQSHSWAANWFAASQEIPSISRNPKVHYRTHKRLPPVSILGQPNPVHMPILKHAQLPFLPQCQRPSFTTIQNNRQDYSSIYLDL